jgi:two-component system chemotaxis response regulator CheY
MRELSIIIVDDQPEVGQALSRDLAHLAHTQIFVANSASEARDAIEDLILHDQAIAVLLVDCVMPGESGVELLRSLSTNRSLNNTRRVMVTGQATQSDTIAAINDGHLGRYVEKPWQAEALVHLVREELTRYVIAVGEAPLPYGETLDPTLVRQAAANDLDQP